MKIKGISAAVLFTLLTFALCSCSGGDDSTLTEAVRYSVTFNYAGGGEAETVEVTEGGTLTEPAVPVRDGYIFMGWVGSDDKEWSFSTDTVKGNITLTAKWIDASTVFGYETTDGGAVITVLKSEYSKMVRVPHSINGLTVVGIGDGVFDGKTSEKISSVTVPDTVTSIGKNTFRGCAGIKITVEGSLTHVGENAFLGCDGLNSVSFGEGLSEIATQAFSGCTSLTELRFPSTLSKIEENAFEDCSSVVFAVMHGRTKVGNSAFIGCDALVTVYYYGDAAAFDSIYSGENDAHGNSRLTDASLYIYSAEKPGTDGKFWYLDEKGKIKLWK